MISSTRTKTFNRKQQTENRKLSTALLSLIALALAIGSCGRGPLQKNPVIVFGSPDSPRLRQAVAGLQAALLNEGPVEVVCAPEFGPEARETLRRVRERRPRLLVVLGTPALLLAAPMVKQLPTVFGLVADPYFTQAAFDPAHPEIHQENVTGIASPAPLQAALQHGASLFGKNPWGLLYDPDDGVAVDLARRFEHEAPRFGVQPLTETSAGAATDADGLSRLMQRGARVIYLPPTPGAARYASRLLDWGRQMKVRVVSGLPEGPRQGAVLWVALDYRRLGEEIGDLARRVLKGERPQTIPIAEKIPLLIEVDETLARKWSGYPPVNN
jgi:putative tryptophan/tyrosine transport system substrate-binding protein